MFCPGGCCDVIIMCNDDDLLAINIKLVILFYIG